MHINRRGLELVERKLVWQVSVVISEWIDVKFI